MHESTRNRPATGGSQPRPETAPIIRRPQPPRARTWHPRRARYLPTMLRQLIALETDVADGVTLKFEYVQEGVPREGFLARVRDQIVAYENVCRHLPITLDFGDNHIFTRDRKYFACQSHGAVYDPLTGLCLHGPCAGASLKPLRVVNDRGQLWLELTDAPA